MVFVGHGKRVDLKNNESPSVHFVLCEILASSLASARSQHIESHWSIVPIIKPHKWSNVDKSSALNECEITQKLNETCSFK